MKQSSGEIRARKKLRAVAGAPIAPEKKRAKAQWRQGRPELVCAACCLQAAPMGARSFGV